MGILINQIKDAINKKKVVTIYREGLNTNVIYGEVSRSSDKLLSIIEFLDDGFYEGNTFILMEDITCFTSDGQFLESLKKIINRAYYEKWGKNIEPDITSMSKLIEDLMEKKEICEIYTEHFNDSFYVGIVDACDNIHVKINEYGGLTGLDKREKVLRIRDITKIKINSKYAANLRTLIDQ